MTQFTGRIVNIGFIILQIKNLLTVVAVTVVAGIEM